MLIARLLTLAVCGACLFPQDGALAPEGWSRAGVSAPTLPHEMERQLQVLAPSAAGAGKRRPPVVGMRLADGSTTGT